MRNDYINPFEVRTPEALSPLDTAKLFVDVFTDFHKIKEIGHTFIHGPRGTGKSMMLRYLEPDVQLAAGNVFNINELQYYAVHVPIKKAWSDITEWSLLEGGSYYVIAEHIMVTHILFTTFKSINRVVESRLFNNVEFISGLNRLLKNSGHIGVDFEPDSDVLDKVERVFEDEFMGIKQYLRRLLFKSMNDNPYNGAIFTYLDFVVPLFDLLRGLGFLCNGPMFLLIDDADQLDEGMQRVLNTWVSCRTIDTVCLKIATQMRYKTYRTIDGKLIESPHDYSEINIGSIYTRDGSKYMSRIKEIVEKRLRLIGVNCSAEEFFPDDEKQKTSIDKIKKEIIALRENGSGLGGNRASDDTTRFAVPIYMSRLAGNSKSSSTFSYAGFRSLVDLSSGVIRWFLDPAAKMYSEVSSLHQSKLNKLLDIDKNISKIPPDIQDNIIKDWSFEFIDSEFSKLRSTCRTEKEESTIYTSSHVTMLLNLVTALGETFRARLLDENATERKIFSIMIADDVVSPLDQVLDMGVELGYLQRSSIGSKEGRGRKPKFTLSRRLAPYFKLDPSGYAYNLSVTSEALMKSLRDPKAFTRERLSKGNNDGIMQIQQTLDI
ncbi:ORC-CDC6 family AAA ATPase [Aeromonas lusitana]|uniref:ORC-CDC6 family AAA ATPase n=1 Tax=Aeromonas lusitana TaxID=931529 RepID=UPI0012FD8111|nr:hypothetical protein [Aeromonas lusitana]